MGSLDQLLSDLHHGSGIFSPIALSSTQKLGRKVAAAIPGAVANVEGARIGAAADVFGHRQRRMGAVETTGMEQTGAMEREEVSQAGETHRKRIAVAGDKIVAQMTADNNIAVQGLRNEGNYQSDDNVARLRNRGLMDATDQEYNLSNNLLMQGVNRSPYTYTPPTAAPGQKKKDEVTPYLDLNY